MKWVVAFFGVFIGLLLVIGIHELGHALVARCFGVSVRRVSIGFGKPLVQWQSRKGTEWVWALWPLGGYVQLLNSRIAPVQPHEEYQCFNHQPVSRRFLILLAGAMANLVVAGGAFFVVGLLGQQRLVPVVQAVVPFSIAADAGLQPGVKLVRVANQNTPGWQEAGMQFVKALGQKECLVLVENQAGQQQEFTLDLSLWRNVGDKKSLLEGIGIVPDQSVRLVVAGVSSWEAVKQAGVQIGQWIVFFFIALKQLVMGFLPFGLLLGPFGFLEIIAGSFSQGVVAFLQIIAVFSLAIGVMNLLPIPGLDGGSMLYAVLEKIRGKPVSVRLEVLLYRLTFIAFCLLLVQLLLNDLHRYV